jgi:transposase
MTLTEKFHAIPQDMELWQKFYNTHQQEYLRKRLKSIRLLWEGNNRPEVCKILGCSYFTLSKWLEIFVAEIDEDRFSRLIKKENITPIDGGKVSRKRRQASRLVKKENITPTYRALFNITWVEEKNRPSFLTEEQMAELKKCILEKKPVDVGLEKNIWTADMIARHIENEYGVIYKPVSIYDVLYRLNLSHQKAHADYAEADPDKQKAFVEEVLKKKVENPQAGEKIVAFDEFAAYDRPSLYYGWAEKNTSFKLAVRQAKKRQRLNGLLAVDLLSGEEFLRFTRKSKSEDLADYFLDLAQDAQTDGFSKLSVFLDNVSTHYKMPRLLKVALREKQVGIEVDFFYTASYSPKLNPAEYVIHKVRQEFFHHLSDNASWDDINETIACHLDDYQLLDRQQIANIIRHIYELVE